MPQEVAIQDEKAQAALQKLMDRVKEVGDGGRKIAGAFSAIIFRDIMSHFERGEGPDAKPWEKWSDVYQKHMEKIGKSGNRILQDTGHLRQAFLPTNYRKVGEGILWFNPAKTKGGFPYAYAHNEGGPKLPARTFMWTSDDASEKLAQVTLDFVLGKESYA